MINKFTTLNDMTCASNGDYSCCEDKGITGNPHSVSTDKLREVAREWIGYLIIDLNYRNGENKRLQNHQTNFNERPIMNEKIKHFEDDIKKIGAQISWIKNFFNLEDKKQDR